MFDLVLLQRQLHILCAFWHP